VGDERLLGMIYRPKGTMYGLEDEEGSIEGKREGTQGSSAGTRREKRGVCKKKPKTETK
jgi:hypothetical protein